MKQYENKTRKMERRYSTTTVWGGEEGKNIASILSEYKTQHLVELPHGTEHSLASLLCPELGGCAASIASMETDNICGILPESGHKPVV